METTGEPLDPRYLNAIAYAGHLHNRQKRKGTDIPYLTHLLSVSALVLEDGGNVDEGIAGLLHDAVEDAGGLETLNQIRERFGERVADIVAACSDSGTQAGDELEPKRPWRKRKEHHLQMLQAVTDPGVLRVSAADKLHNAESILADLDELGLGMLERFNAPPADIAWYYTQMAAVLARQLGPCRLTRRLSASAHELANRLLQQEQVHV